MIDTVDVLIRRVRIIRSRERALAKAIKNLNLAVLCCQLKKSSLDDQLQKAVDAADEVLDDDKTWEIAIKGVTK